jgi:DNA-directed RNA polymerase subunit RPC12/RpoP
MSRWIDIWLDWLDQFAHLFAPTTRNCIFCGKPMIRYESKNLQDYATFKCDDCHARTAVKEN